MILITGGTGFLGKKVVAQLLQKDFKLLLLVRDLPIQNHNRKEDKIQYCLATAGDINAIDFSEIEGVIHMATAYGRVEATHKMAEINFEYPLLIYKLLKEQHKSAFFINCDSFFTDYVFTYKYLTNYINSKFYLKKALQMLSGKHVPVINVKIYHMYGAGDSKDKFIPSLLNQLLKNEPEIKVTSGIQIRDFVYADDVAMLIINNVHKYSDNNSLSLPDYINIEAGTGTGISVKDALLIMKEETGSSSRLLFGSLPDKEGEIMYAVASKKADSNQFTLFKEGIKHTIGFFKQYYV